MRRILLLIAAPFVFLSVTTAQVTQEQADEIVLQRISQNTQVYYQYILFAKESIQTKMSVTTAAGEEIELDYPCWVYYVSYYIDCSVDMDCVHIDLGRYLIINENNGNLLEVKPRSYTAPSDLAEWRVAKAIYPITIETTNFSLPQGCAWDGLIPDSLYVINSRAELSQHLACWANVILDVDLDKYTLLAFIPKYYNCHSKVEKILLQQQSGNEYLLSVDIIPSATAVACPLFVSVLVPKIAETASVELEINIADNTPFSNAQMTNSVNQFSMEFFATAHEELRTDENIVRAGGKSEQEF